MRYSHIILAVVLLLNSRGSAAPKGHIVNFGGWTTITWRGPGDQNTSVNLKIRPLLVDGRAKEFTTGSPHDVTDRTFVVQRVFRLNDALPKEPGPAKWRWQLGGWLLVDRVSGKAQPITLPEFDSDLSEVMWFRDYAAYCGISEDGHKLIAVVAQLGRRKPLLKKVISEAGDSTKACAPPTWERTPVRVTFEPDSDHRLTFVVKTRAFDAIEVETPDNNESAGAE